MISFAFLWWRKNKFLDPHYPWHIAEGIAANTSHECDFVCITDQVSEPTVWEKDGLKIRAFPCVSRFSKHQHRKLEVFRPELSLAPRAVLTDLDNFITGDLDELLAYDGRFGGRRTFCANPDRDRPQPQLSWGMFDTEACHFIWDMAQTMTDDEINTYAPVGGGRGDQLFVYKALGCEYDRLDDLYPGQLESWKWGHIQGRAPDARVLFAHGQPKPHQLQWSPDGEVASEARGFVQTALSAGEARYR